MTRPLDVALVVPVYNEEATLETSIRRLHTFLCDGLPFSWRIVVADNASTDSTPVVAAALAAELDGVELLRLEEKGRGRALRAAWSRSDARVVAYMDVDLSTDLRGLLPLVAPLLSGHSDIAIGTRLAKGANVVRGPRREVISRAYNLILHTVLLARFSDAQCGFKAVRADIARDLLADVRDDEWFFDTELLVCAQRRGLRIHEVPVDWVDDADSRVDIVRTARDDLRGVLRLWAAGPVPRFMAIGLASTLAYAVLLVMLRDPIGVTLANGAALALTAIANTQANRRITFRIKGRPRLLRHHLMALVVFLLTLVVTNEALVLLHALDHAPSRELETSVLAAAGAAATVARYMALRSWVFASGLTRVRAAERRAPVVLPRRSEELA